MKNNYEAPEVFTISTTRNFVLGAKPSSFGSIDAILGLNYSFWMWLNDLDEDEN